MTTVPGPPFVETSEIILFSAEGFSISLMMSGCAGDLRLRFSDVLEEGKDHNLSAFFVI